MAAAPTVFPKYGLTGSNLDYDQTAIFQHSDTKAVNRVEIINIGSVQAGGLHGHSLADLVKSLAP